MISPYFVVALYVLLLPRNMSEITGKIEEFETAVRQRTTICTLVVLINIQYANLLIPDQIIVYFILLCLV